MGLPDAQEAVGVQLEPRSQQYAEQSHRHRPGRAQQQAAEYRARRASARTFAATEAVHPKERADGPTEAKRASSVW